MIRGYELWSGCLQTPDWFKVTVDDRVLFEGDVTAPGLTGFWLIRQCLYTINGMPLPDFRGWVLQIGNMAAVRQDREVQYG